MRRKPLKRVTPDDRPVMPEAEAKKRFLLYLALKLSGLAALFGGVFLAREATSPTAIALLIAGAVALFLRPKHLGLTTRR